MTETTRPRANRDGHLCPPWCQTDHEQVHGAAGTFAFHGGTVTRIEVDGKTSLPDEITARAFHVGHPGREPVVSVALVQHGPGARNPQAWLSPADAERLAAILGTIGDWDQFSRLVTALRRAAAQAAEDSHG